MPVYRVTITTHYFVKAKNAKQAMNDDADMNQIWNNARYDIERVDTG